MATKSKIRKNVPEPGRIVSGAIRNTHENVQKNGQEIEQEDEELMWMRRHMRDPEKPDLTAHGIAGIVQGAHIVRVERYAKNPGRQVVRKTAGAP